MRVRTFSTILNNPKVLGVPRTKPRSRSRRPPSGRRLVKNSGVNVEKIAGSVGVRLTPNELILLRKNINSYGTSPQSQFEKYGREALKRKTTQEVCLDAIANPCNPVDKWGVRFISMFDYAGTALFAIVGTQVAGDTTGMNIVGSCLVGCAAALGGGSLNAVLYGVASPLLGKRGVRWVANPSYLYTAVAASVLTFFAWPYYCETQANYYLEDVIGKDNLDPETGNISKETFMEAWKNNEQFRQTITDALPHVKTTSNLLSEWKILNMNRDQGKQNTNNNNMNDKVGLLALLHDNIKEEEENINDGDLYFQQIDENHSGDICMHELRLLIQRRFYNGWETYWLDTFGLSALSIAAVVMAIRGGLHPLVACTSGVTVCFGGILRDLLCGRDLAIGSQSYAFCTGASSTMYIFLRELALRRILVLPLSIRTFASVGTCVGLRGWEWLVGEPLLNPMHRKDKLKDKRSSTRERN